MLCCLRRLSGIVEQRGSAEQAADQQNLKPNQRRQLFGSGSYPETSRKFPVNRLLNDFPKLRAYLFSVTARTVMADLEQLGQKWRVFLIPHRGINSLPNRIPFARAAFEPKTFCPHINGVVGVEKQIFVADHSAASLKLHMMVPPRLIPAVIIVAGIAEKCAKLYAKVS